jgi:uncharacterized protein
MSDSIEIYGQKIYPGSHKEIRIVIAQLPTHTTMDLPVFVFRGKEPGPSLLLCAGLHGDEVNGTEILRRMIREHSLSPDKGTTIVLPIINVFGFLHSSRDLPDGKDLNRSFPGSKSGSLAMRTAHVIMKEVIPHIDFGVDLHTGGAQRTNYPQIRCVTSVPINMKLAEGFGAPMILNSNFIDKSFRKEAWKMGKSIIVYEGGESRRFDEFAIQEGMDGIRRLMDSLDMKKTGSEARKSILLKSSNWLRAKTSGLFRTLVLSGSKVEKNQVIALLTDTYGKHETKVKAPAAGYVIGMSNHPVVHEGDALVHFGTE